MKLSLNKFSILDRYIVGELNLAFIFGLGLFSALGVAVGSLFDLLAQVRESRLLFDVALKVMALKMPEFIGFALPMAVLLATLIVYSRLSGDSEIVALRSLGISVYRLILPALLFSILVTTLTFIFKDQVIPRANAQATLILDQALQQQQGEFRDEKIIYPEYGEDEVLKRLFYAAEFDGKQMRDLTIIDRSNGSLNQIVTAEAAGWDLARNQWNFQNGIIYLINADGSSRNVLRFDQHQIQLSNELDLNQEEPKHEDMSLAELQRYIATLAAQPDRDETNFRKLKVRFQEKISFPFICLAIGLIGAAIGLRPQSASKATGFGLCVGLVFGYYFMAFMISSVGVAGYLHPILAAWLPNLIVMAIAMGLVYQTAK
ncbi:permease, YjgP/YjgQ family protein [[Synechococcus] sp. NIES-970]|uniref:LptF/LptG family permease n=1 Tax=Picosynechococcus sp. NKBG15041c TaxID=1407650 RepID=UPI0004679A29|nr:LptF/LptG family permease [Picosynechococcus sp. NKBG15041c]BAW95556.1 permease, YjgP/YjgQ family protein [[Synechococcus] sp. NIES-970]